MRSYRNILFILLLLSSMVRASELDRDHLPSRAEWLKLALTTGIHEQSSLWRERVAVIVVIDSKNNTASVVITFANGAPGPSTAEKERYIDSVQSIARNILAKYPWAKDVQLLVEFS